MIAIIRILALARVVSATMGKPVTVAPALPRAANTAGRVITATTPVGRTQTVVTAYPRGITRTRIGAAIRIVATTTTTRTTRQRTAITHRG